MTPINLVWAQTFAGAGYISGLAFSCFKGSGDPVHVNHSVLASIDHDPHRWLVLQ